jgi:nucleotide-binding universal stress UspA family protein
MPASGDGRILSEVKRPMKILVASDGSEGSQAALRFADRLASNVESADLVVITVGALRRELFVSHLSSNADFAVSAEIEREERDLGRRTLEAAEHELKAHRDRCRFRFVQPRRLGSVAEAIAYEADRERADLIVVGTDRYGTLASWALGSVSARLLQVARRPVTVVHVARRRSRGGRDRSERIPA